MSQALAAMSRRTERIEAFTMIRPLVPFMVLLLGLSTSEAGQTAGRSRARCWEACPQSGDRRDAADVAENAFDRA